MGKKDRLKVLTRSQKEAISAYGLNPKDYLFVEDVSDSYFKIIHKDYGSVKLIDRYAKLPKRRNLI